MTTEWWQQMLPRLRARDGTAWAEVHSVVFKWARFRWADHPDAEDLAQETVIYAFKNVEKLKPETASAWLSQYNKHHKVDIWRLKGKGRESSLDESTDGSAKDPPSMETSPLESVLDQERRQRVKKCIEDLTALQREAIVLHFYEDKLLREIADLEGIPVGTVGTRINAGKIQLRESLKTLGYGGDA